MQQGVKKVPQKPGLRFVREDRINCVDPEKGRYKTIKPIAFSDKGYCFLFAFPTRFGRHINKKARPKAWLDCFVGKTGFEPATPWSQTRCATGLRYFPNMVLEIYTLLSMLKLRIMPSIILLICS